MEQTAGTLGTMRAVVMVRQERVAGHLQGPMPAAGCAAAVLLCWRGLGGPPPQFGALLVPLAGFPSSPHCRLPGNTTCQQNAVGLMELLPLGIWQSQAEGMILGGIGPQFLLPVGGQ